MKNIVSICVLSLLYNLPCQHAIIRLGCVLLSVSLLHTSLSVYYEMQTFDKYDVLDFKTDSLGLRI